MKKKMITLIITLLLNWFIDGLHGSLAYTHVKEDVITQIIKEPVYDDEVLYSEIKGTVYHPVPEQTDSSPLYTADNSFIDTTKINELRWIAASRDILDRKFTDYRGNKYVWTGKIKMGDTVWVDYDTLRLKEMAVNRKGEFNEKRYQKLKERHELIKGYWVVKDIMGTHYYRSDVSGNLTRVNINKAIDFLQHPKTGFLDMWDRSIIITKRKLVGYKYVQKPQNRENSKNVREVDDV